MSDTVEHTAYGEVQRLWLANIICGVLAMLQNFIGFWVAVFCVLGYANLNNLTGWLLWASVVMGLRTYLPLYIPHPSLTTIFCPPSRFSLTPQGYQPSLIDHVILLSPGSPVPP